MKFDGRGRTRMKEEWAGKDSKKHCQFEVQKEYFWT